MESGSDVDLAPAGADDMLAGCRIVTGLHRLKAGSRLGTDPILEACIQVRSTDGLWRLHAVNMARSAARARLTTLWKLFHESIDGEGDRYHFRLFVKHVADLCRSIFSDALSARRSSDVSQSCFTNAWERASPAL